MNSKSCFRIAWIVSFCALAVGCSMSNASSGGNSPEPRSEQALSSEAPDQAVVNEAPEQRLGGAKVKLPPPRTDRGLPLMKALKLRQTKRRISDKQLPIQMLSDLLWAAFGVNREKSGKRTAPSAVNAREIDIYVATESGLYLYAAEDHRLDREQERDLRELTGKQSFVRRAPVDLIFVADYTRFEDMDPADKDLYAATDTGYISQNVYLFCASEELATVAIGYLDRDRLASALKLRPEQRVILTQPVGYPR